MVPVLGLLLAGTVLLVPSFATSSPLGGTSVSVDDPHWYFTEYNWRRSAAEARTANPGAYCKLGFTGSSFSLLLNTSGLASSAMVKVAYTVDDSMWRFATLNASSVGAGATALALAVPPLPKMANARTHHDLKLVLFSSDETHDRWRGGTADSAYLVILGAVLDAGAATVAPQLLPRRAIIYGDSITEGTNTQLYDWDQGQCSRHGLAAEGAFKSWCFGFGEALEAEVSNCAFAAQGYSTFNSLTYGGVPPLLTVGDDAMTAWDKFDATHSRLQALKARPPDFVINAEGFNDQVCSPPPVGHPTRPNINCTNAKLQAAVTAWLAAMRAATSPTTDIVVLVPFGGEMRTENLTRFAIRDGFHDYIGMSTHPQQQAAEAAGQEEEGRRAGHDSHALLIDLYPRAKRGLMGASSAADAGGASGQPAGPTAESCDGTHPLGWRHAQLGAMVAAEYVRQSNARDWVTNYAPAAVA